MKERRVGIVGNERAKFTVHTAEAARCLIAKLLDGATAVVSGHCHLGGVDIWAEQTGRAMKLGLIIHRPAELNWQRGFKPRNIAIARDSTEVHVIVVAKYPRTYTDRKFEECYHCKRKDHVKSGGCWTGIRALKLARPVTWHIIAPNGAVTSKEG